MIAEAALTTKRRFRISAALAAPPDAFNRLASLRLGFLAIIP